MSLKKVFYVIKKKVKISNLILLIVLLMFNSYAWFIYNTKVSTSLSAKIEAWDIAYISNGIRETQNIILDVEKIYPGMTIYTHQITVNNNGDTNAELSFAVRKVEILGQVYQVDATTTPEMLYNKLQNDFPFKTTVTLSTTQLPAHTGTATVTIKLEWKYESEVTGKDELDTQYGTSAYQFITEHPDTPCVHLEIELGAKQVNT